ncbi:MAG: hypothetical protein DM484_18965 [Candidatus Methylumidiphilus alinenensis]|uniref:Uncharacterized protein n=1 Tax=Candidatus Methylumidiphilus alinenensis TaxID=2202197 RepID=A0A2W4QWE1_9GAMM|nr:MAG: hypothetical protein DM484_18965 [Candidatus Methylumidiphilus alinenensis]
MHTEITKQILKKYFKDECDLIGRENFIQLFDESSRVIEADYGENMPIFEVIGFLVGIIGFVDSAFSLYERMTSSTEQNIKSDQFILLARKQLQIPEDVDDSVIISILEMVAKDSKEL